ncbi:hypothetical protein AYO21_09257 [Fonsecaea monophora]|uniref:Uncharacterized protein n=1 Tax=Fonsecaea monophora TaxID=254056 RepID=A0A177EY48_9EURO|nr:hypothetical protein AYO21_09257 [Fonsecaea monophora]OAG36526.1 hypothetical protein AYO21_09257 [Fonsecaea monophora]
MSEVALALSFSDSKAEMAWAGTGWAACESGAWDSHLVAIEVCIQDVLGVRMVAQKEMLPQSTEGIVEVQGTPEGIDARDSIEIRLGFEARSTVRRTAEQSPRTSNSSRSISLRKSGQDQVPNSNTADKIIHDDSRAYPGQFSDDGDFFFRLTQNFKVRMDDT